MSQRHLVLVALLMCGPQVVAQDTTARLFHAFTVEPNITYLTASNYESKLDLYVTRTPERPLPTPIYIQGDRWINGTKEDRNLEVLPYLEMGMNVVNVECDSPRSPTLLLLSKILVARCDGPSPTQSNAESIRRVS